MMGCLKLSCSRISKKTLVNCSLSTSLAMVIMIVAIKVITITI